MHIDTDRDNRTDRPVTQHGSTEPYAHFENSKFEARNPKQTPNSNLEGPKPSRPTAFTAFGAGLPTSPKPPTAGLP
ncbi:MAG TPA: hypothetical protein PLF81_19325, partial [Candidatus Anammoximicrobium sp.]|nr:hypothetical protein [Candidatus Anammoximicrobium sp.]